MMLVEGEDIDDKVVNKLEEFRKLFQNIRPEISKVIRHWGTACLDVRYVLNDLSTTIQVEVEPRYLKYLGLEIPEWVVKMLNTNHH